MVIGLALSIGAAACGSVDPSGSGVAASASPAAAATRFLARYVTGDGRVIRHDQGGDIVSEGQAYGMLIAEVAGKPGLMRTIWSWTNAHLRNSDRLFAWHATGTGQIESPQSATDADVLIAYALLRYQGTDQKALHGAGRAVAKAVLSNEAILAPNPGPVLVAGPWAKSTSPAPTVDPSYLMPGVFNALARLTGDRRWTAAADTAIALVRGLTDDGHSLPPDWATFSGSALIAAPQPGGGAGVQYGLDAARVPIWFATACHKSARTLAANWWRNVLRANDRTSPIALSLTGSTITPGSSPLMLLAAAAAATAAGDHHSAHELQARAEALALKSPTYYGDAWAALGPALLDATINPCGADG
jgi:endoglucanase